MDRYNEQLIRKASETRDYIIRSLIIAGTVAVTAFSVISVIMFGAVFGVFPLIIGFGAIYLGYWLLGNTVVEYEYIVTNKDLDVDKILGKRKRRRLVSIDLSQATGWGQYTGTEGDDSDATVMATDATGTGTWYLTAGHDRLGKVTILFTPNRDTAEIINQGVPFKLKADLGKDDEKEEQS